MKLMDIADKVVIVTGASSGIGLATAKLLASLGASVALVARSKDKLTRLTAELPGSFARPTDMSSTDEIKDMVSEVKNHYGRIDILINNAGQGYDALVSQIDSQTLHQIFDLDFVGPLTAMQQVIPIMQQQGQGAIINISSGTALMHLPDMGAYAAIKAALAHLSLTAREELKAFNINVSVVYPYITDTHFEDNTIKSPPVESQDEASGGYRPPKADSAVYIAGKIADTIKTNEPECFAHDWMKQPRR
jgi:short-subunit dehydrogenase